MRFVIILLTLINACKPLTKEASCQSTTGSFVEYFNSQDFYALDSLFQPGILDDTQLKNLSNNLVYTYGVAGAIRSLKFTSQEGNKITYLSTHENTTMDITLRVNDRCKLTSYLIKTHYPDSLPVLERNSTSMKLPFKGEWYVKWGGPTLDQNYHNANQNMRGAFDFDIRDNHGKSYRGQGESIEDYYAFGKEVIAPCQATIIKVIDGIDDNSIGKSNALGTYGNALILKTVQEEFLLLAHLKNQSIVVKEGQKVNQGDVLAQCGNSGYSTKPHLHFILQNVADLFHPTGANCYFDDIVVNGSLKQDYTPVQGELISNAALSQN